MEYILCLTDNTLYSCVFLMYSCCIPKCLSRHDNNIYPTTEIHFRIQCILLYSERAHAIPPKIQQEYIFLVYSFVVFLEEYIFLRTTRNMTQEENCIVLYSCCILWMQNRIQCIPVCIPHKNIYLKCIPICIPNRNIYSTVSLVLSPPRLTKSELQKCIVLFLHCILMSATTSKDTVYS